MLRKSRKNPAAVALGKRRIALMTEEEHRKIAREGGLRGGRTRAKTLSPRRRREIAKKAAEARWSKKKG